MNPINVFERVRRNWKNLDFTSTEETRDKCRFKADIVAEKYFDDGILCEVTVYASGTIHVFFTFDSLERNAENYELINEFNSCTSWAKAYIETINHTDFLQLHYAYYSSASEVEAAEQVDAALNNLLSDSVLKVLQPLTARTR